VVGGTKSAGEAVKKRGCGVKSRSRAVGKEERLFNLVGRLVGNMVRFGFDGKLRLMLRGFSVCSFSDLLLISPQFFSCFGFVNERLCSSFSSPSCVVLVF
jgi:hypothetical protein